MIKRKNWPSWNESDAVSSSGQQTQRGKNHGKLEIGEALPWWPVLVANAENYLLNIEQTLEDENGGTVNRALREETPGLFALTRNRFPAEPPTGKKLEAIRQQMLRIHRASGHAPFSRLQKLLAVHKAPKWAIELAGNLQCPSCIEAKRACSSCKSQ